MSKEPEYIAHREWLGFVQPVGLIVSIPALLSAQAHVNRNIASEHQRFLSLLSKDDCGQTIPAVPDLADFLTTLFGWDRNDLQVFPNAPPPDFAGLEIVLPEYHETLRPTHF